jgi:hypothetical protein
MGGGGGGKGQGGKGKGGRGGERLREVITTYLCTYDLRTQPRA